LLASSFVGLCSRLIDFYFLTFLISPLGREKNNTK